MTNKKSYYYHGKDFVHEGSLLILDPKKAWKKISPYTRRNIKRAQKFDTEIKKVEGTKKEMAMLKSIWHNPNDPFLPKRLEKGGFMYMAYLEGDFAAAMVLLPAGNNLYLNNLAATNEGKRKYVTNLLLWGAINDLKNLKYKYIDIGVSFRKSLQTYFTHWQTDAYPIIFEPPEILPKITFSPFTNTSLITYKKVQQDTEFLIPYFGKEYTILPSTNECLEVIKALKTKVEICTWIQIPNKKSLPYKLYDLTKIFPMQYGAILKGIKISDEDNWNIYKFLDYYKKELVTMQLKKYLPKLGVYEKKVIANYKFLEDLFLKEGFEVLPQNKNHPTMLQIKLNEPKLMQKRYSSFGVETQISPNTIGFPVHYNLTKEELRYIYAIFRGKLNLYNSYKRELHAK